MDSNNFYGRSTSEHDSIIMEMETFLIKWIKSFLNVKSMAKTDKSSSDICARAEKYFVIIQKEHENSTCLKEKSFNDINSDQHSSFRFIADEEWYNSFRRKAVKHNLMLNAFKKPIYSISAALNDLITSNEYSREQIWIGAHFGLYYKQMPSGTCFGQTEEMNFLKKKGPNKSNKHISLLLTGNISFDGELHHHLKPLVCHDGPEKPKWLNDIFNDFVNDIVLVSDPKKARLTKSIMLKWLREHFVKEVQNYYQDKDIFSDKIILLMSDAFQQYFVDEALPDKIKILFIPDRIDEHSGFVYDTKSTIVEPFIAKYIANVFDKIDTCSKISVDSPNVIWQKFDVSEAIKSIMKLSKENFGNHARVWRAPLCPCSPLLNLESKSSQGLDSVRNEAILNAVEVAHQYEHDKVSLAGVIELVDCNIRELNNDKLTEVVLSTANSTESDSNGKKSSDETILSSPSKTPKRKRKSSVDLEEKSYQTKMKKETIEKGLSLMEKAITMFKSEISCPADEHILKEFDKPLEHFQKKVEQMKHELQFTDKKQTSIYSYFSTSFSKGPGHTAKKL